MKTTVNFTATISFRIDETWMENSPISQIKKDAERSARSRLARIFQPDWASYADTKLVSVEIHGESEA